MGDGAVFTGLVSMLAFAAGVSGQATPCGANVLLSIVGSDDRRPEARYQLLALFGLGLFIGGQAMALALIGTGLMLRSLFPGFGLVVVSASALWAGVYLIGLLSGRSIRVPTRMWLVPQSWAVPGLRQFSFRFGVALGMGWVTVVSFAGLYSLFLLLLVMPPGTVVLGMAVFALGRFATALLLTVSANVCTRAGYRLSPSSLISTLGPFDRILPVLRMSGLASAIATAVIVVFGA